MSELSNPSLLPWDNKLRKKAVQEKAKACLRCPLFRAVSATIGHYTFVPTVDNVRVRVSCGAAGGVEVKPKRVDQHTQCSLYQKWERGRQRARERGR